MDATSKAREYHGKMRDPELLFHLRRRPRCLDGSLDMRCSVNKGFTKWSHVSNFYDPKDPS